MSRNVLKQDLFDIFYKARLIDRMVVSQAEEILSRILFGFSLSDVNRSQNEALHLELFTAAVKKYIVSTKRFSVDFIALIERSLVCVSFKHLTN